MIMSGWDVSQLYRLSAAHLTATTRGAVVHTHNDKLVTRDNSTLAISSVATATPRPDSSVRSQAAVVFSHLAIYTPPSGHPLVAAAVASATSSVVHEVAIYALGDEHACARIQIGAEGFAGLMWAKNSPTLLLWSAHQLRVTIVSFASESGTRTAVIDSPKYPAGRGVSFGTCDGVELLALIERHDGKDHVGLYDLDDLTLLRHMALPNTFDAGDIAWSPTDSVFAVWEQPCGGDVLICSADAFVIKRLHLEPRVSRPLAPTRQLGNRSEPKSRDGRPRHARDTPPSPDELDSENAPIATFGVRSFAWRSQGDYLALGAYDGKIHIISSITWSTIASFAYTPKSQLEAGCSAWAEPQESSDGRSRGIASFVPLPTAWAPEHARPDYSRAASWGVSSLAWSASGRHLAASNTAYPNEVWVMRVGNDVPRLATILHHNRATREFAWCSRRRHGGDMLVVTSGIAGFTVWEEGEDGEAGTAVAVPVPAKSPFAVERAAFDLDGSSVLLSDRSTFAVASQP